MSIAITQGMAAKKDGDEGSRPAGAAWRKSLFDDLLRGIRLRTSIFFRPELQAPWGIEMARECAIFHIVDYGACWLQVNGVSQAVHLSEGDFVVVTTGPRHALRDQLTTDKTCVRRDGVREPYRHPLLAILPPVLHVKRTEEGVRRLGLTTAHLRSELDGGGAGANEIVTRLADILLIQAVRDYFEQKPQTLDDGWLAAVQDPKIGQALAILHSHPHRPWTVPSLARRLAMSRSTFAERFKELVGEPPQRYFTRLRIHAAAARLRSGDDKLSAIAAAAGFESLAAFAKAFKKQIGETPGDYRKTGDRVRPPLR